ncbi:MAG: MFS transporter [Kiritimatiellae bacterium]|nr:MFS transporter [Kiritimatiellia bacterium]
MTAFGYTEGEYRLFRSNAWRYLLLFSLLYCFLYCTRLNLSNAGAVMIRDLGWSKADFGVLTGALFWAYGVGQLVNGRISEIVGPGKFVIASVVLSVAANILFSFQTSIVAMAVIWGMNGFFQSMAWTPGVAILTKWWPGKTRGFATGFAHAFSGFGQATAILAVALAFKTLPGLGWRAAFILPAAFPFALLFVYAVRCRTSPRRAGLAEYVEDDPARAAVEAEMRGIVSTRGKLYPYRYMLANGHFVVWVVIAFITGLARYGLVTWIPLYFIDRFGIDVTAGLLGSLSLPFGMGVGTLVVPWLTDKWCPNDRLPAVVSAAILGAVSIAGFMMCDPTVGWQMAVVQILLFTAGFCIYAINGTAWAYATDIGGRVFSGTSSGVLNFAAYMGAAAQSFVYGFLLSRIGWASVFVSLAVLCAAIAVFGLLGSKSLCSFRLRRAI